MARTYSPTYHILNYTTLYISINNRFLIVSLYNATDKLNIEDINTDNNEERKLYSNYYMKFLDVNTLQELVSKPQKLIESDIKDYLIYLRNQRKIAYTTESLYLNVLREFFLLIQITISNGIL